jgi:hypothetical protein
MAARPSAMLSKRMAGSVSPVERSGVTVNGSGDRRACIAL